MSRKEEKERDYRKGVLEQQPSATASHVKPVLLEYEVLEHQASFWDRTGAGWNKHGRYKSRAQALRVIKELDERRARGGRVYGPPTGCRWRIDGVEVEGA